MSDPRERRERALGDQLNALLSASRVLTERSAAAFHPDLQPAAFHLARWIYAYGSAKPSVVAEAVGMDRSAASSLLKTMRERGLVDSTPDQADRRAVVVDLTPAGRERVRRALDLRGSSLRDRIAQWSDEELDAFTAMLRAFNSAGESTRRPWPAE
ncbi:MarR family winged helix-turn-helix transcriptional regulator [Promicromonospora sp. NPDC052451]|uniref:MarR family winged helix-turn-helix transcriptional regulator n=1 Tax=Promicromonospora sp. NPDC052451 TaxID=3364407 RepID=UPI0037C5BB45